MLALLALGLNLIFGVIDIVWIAYVDLVMLCMYGVYFLVQVYGWPLWLAGAGRRSGSARCSASRVHLLIITPILASPPINQLLATGGLLFFIQSFATLLWTTDHRSRARVACRPSRSAASSSVHPADRLRALDPGHDRALPLPHAHLHGHRDPRGQPGPRGHRAHGRAAAAALPRDLRGGRARWRAWRARC